MELFLVFVAGLLAGMAVAILAVWVLLEILALRYAHRWFRAENSPTPRRAEAD